MIGTAIGNFEIIALLGKGGMGEVWLAQQTNFKTKVAIKILAADISNNRMHVQRFHNEAIAVGQIPHSGIVKIFDGALLPDGRAYLVMEYLQGETLGSRIKRMGRLELPLIADFGRQIASVLDATHHAGITHRDLKPENIYLVRDAELAHGERIKILDFGIAKLDTTIGPRMTSASASSIGTPNYMSPEQWHSLADSDWRTDAYALGCVAFEMATGRPPFIAQSRVEVCAMHLGELPPVPSSFAKGIPPELDRLVARLLEKEPANRPPMRDAIAIFTALGQGQGVALSTLPPDLLSPFAANASSSMQYRVTPRAMESARLPTSPSSMEYGQTPVGGNVLGASGAIPITGGADLRDDTTPIASMSLQFKPTPPSGFESQSGMRAITEPDPRGASQGMQMHVPKKRRVGLVVAIVLVVVVAAVVIAIVAGSSSNKAGSQASGSGASGSAIAVERGSSAVGSSAVGSGSASDPRIRRLPPRKDPVAMPEVDAPLELSVCIDPDGEVESVTLANGGIPAKPVDAAVSSWEYVPYRGRDGVAKPACGQVTIPARVKGPAVTPTKLTKKLFSDGVGGINEGIFKCARFAPGGGTFTVTIAVSPAGAGTLKMLAVTSGRPKIDKLKACIDDEIKNVRFTKTKEGGGGSTTVQLN